MQLSWHALEAHRQHVHEPSGDVSPQSAAADADREPRHSDSALQSEASIPRTRQAEPGGWGVEGTGQLP